MAFGNIDTVGALVAGSDEIVQPSELLILAEHAGFAVSVSENSLLEYGESVAELVVRRMILMAKMTFMAAYRYGTYTYYQGDDLMYAVVDTDMGPECEGLYVSGNTLELVVDTAYTFLQEAING